MYKILHVLGTLDFGGAEILVRDIHDNLPEHISSEVIFHTDGALNDAFAGKCRKFAFNIFSIREIMAFRRYIKEAGIDLVHVHSVVNPVRLLPVLCFNRVNTVFTVHGYSLNRRPFMKWVIFRWFDLVLFVSETLRKTYLNGSGRHSNKFQVLHNGIDPEKFNGSSDTIRQDLSVPDDVFVMGFVGNFNTVRDQNTVCKALRILKEGGYDFMFLFAGAARCPEQYRECYDYCKEHGLLEQVLFLGSRDDIPEILSSLDLFVYSSNHDTFGIALVEAMMSGIPVMVNDLEVFEEITGHGKHAQLFRSKDEMDLASKIESLMNDREGREQLGREGRKWAGRKYAVQSHLQKLEKMYEALIVESPVKTEV